MLRIGSFASSAFIMALTVSPQHAEAQQVTFPATDGDTVHATWYRTGGTPAALILAFHQGGASGEAEYGPIAARLNREGFDVLAVDQRAGGSLFGGVNRTVRDQGGETGYCEAAPDLEGALAYARAERADLPIILWGSSYSAALVLRLAATNPEAVVAVLAFSPASGEPMTGCRGEEVSHDIDVPVLALRPRGEMEREPVAMQMQLFRNQGHQVFVADPGEHGSSMLVEERVGASIEATWEKVREFLARATH
jgi:alpha-beta hydrolase superfamily lysophospholipase